MIVNEKGLVAAMKDSYKGAGYSVAFGEGRVRLAGHDWSVWCRRDVLPRKALGLIAEHLGKLPKDETAFRISKAMGAQQQLYEEMVGTEEITENRVRLGSRCTVTGLTLAGYDLKEDEVILLIIRGVAWFIADITLRMLTPRELYNAMGFPEDYIIERDYLGNAYGKSKQVARCGNAVCPPLATAMVRANFPEWDRGKLGTMAQFHNAVAV